MNRVGVFKLKTAITINAIARNENFFGVTRARTCFADSKAGNYTTELLRQPISWEKQGDRGMAENKLFYQLVAKNLRG